MHGISYGSPLYRCCFLIRDDRLLGALSPRSDIPRDLAVRSARPPFLRAASAAFLAAFPRAFTAFFAAFRRAAIRSRIRLPTPAALSLLVR